MRPRKWLLSSRQLISSASKGLFLHGLHLGGDQVMVVVGKDE